MTPRFDRLAISWREFLRRRLPGFWAGWLALAVLAGGAALHLGGFLLLPVQLWPEPGLVLPPAPVEVSEVGPSGLGLLLQEQALLLDSAPLFFPTPWNASGQTPVHPPPADLPLFGAYPEAIRLEEAVFPAGLPAWTALPPPGWADLLRAPRAETLWYLVCPSAPAFAPASAPVCEARSPAGRILHPRLPSGPPLPDLAVLPVPARFLLLLDPGGPAGGPLLWESTGSDAVDLALLELLGRPAFRAQLPAGYWLVTVGE